MTHYRHCRREGGCYFFIVVLANRRSRLPIDDIQGLRMAFHEVKQVHPFTIEAVVILPDHLHCIRTLPAGDFTSIEHRRFGLHVASTSKCIDGYDTNEGDFDWLARQTGIWPRCCMNSRDDRAGYWAVSAFCEGTSYRWLRLTEQNSLAVQ